ncbi:alginate lyase family protein [Priestia aryabhattai]|uniref:alginate lyase family protein n=1 Tax=Priestia aryabhattai TaxID=412384 RepID=UPI003D276C88
MGSFLYKNINSLEVHVIKIQKKITVLLILIILIISLLFWWKRWSFDNQTYGIYTQKSINHTKDMVKDKKEPYFNAQQQLLSLADKALIEDVKAPFFLNIPQAYKDSEGHSKASENLTKSAYDAYVLSLAWKLTDELKYKIRAQQILNIWTKNNRLISHKDDTPLVSAYGGVGFIYAGLLLKGDEQWDQSAFRKWVKTVYLPTVKVARDKENNWADWGNLASLAAYSYLDDKNNFNKEVEYTKHLIKTQIGIDGEMVKETGRQKNSMFYTYFALAPLTQSVDVIYNQTGINMFDTTTKEGEKIKRALDNFYFYINHPNQWPYYKLKDLSLPYKQSIYNNWSISLYEAMSGIYDDENYRQYVASYRPVIGGYLTSKTPHHLVWNFPTLLKPNL